MLRILAATCAVLLPLAHAHAGMSDWEEVEGGAVRIVTQDGTAEDGKLRAALEIRLAPGWKTYWRDPGDSGVPPTVSFMAGSEVHEASLDFPAPEWFDDGYSLWAGYGEDVSLPMTVELPTTGAAEGPLQARIFLGICETICIPVQATLDLHPERPDEGRVAAAFDALPEPESDAFTARVVAVEQGGMVVEARVPEDAGQVDLFVAGSAEVPLKAPKLIVREPGMTRYRVAFLHDDAELESTGFDYTLTSDSGAVSGRLELPR